MALNLQNHYIYTSAEVKAETDVCCTSANAVKIVKSLGVKKVIFLPDDYLAKYVASQTDVEIISWKGMLPVSQNFTKIVPTAALSFFYLCAFYLLTFVVNKLPIAIVYATWSGLGIFTIAIMGYIFFKQTLAWQAVLGLFLIVIGVILVNSFTGKVS